MLPMRTLVIHPTDYSTDFLCKIYEGRDWTVVRDKPSKKTLKEAIKQHDRIIMLGHGCEKGLFNSNYDTVIDSNYVYLLREKTCVGIWCNADVFFKKYKLKGLFTGMMISENDEAYMFNVHHVYGDIDQSNFHFSRVMSDNIKNSGDGVYHLDKIKVEYGNLTENQIVTFNKERIFYR
jgi:hypothetical protein